MRTFNLGMMPFNDKKKDEHQTIKDRRTRNIYFPPTYISKTAQDLIMSMLHPEAAKRIVLYDILRHPWLRDTP